MGMAAHEFLANFVGNRIEIEPAFFDGDLGVENHLKKEVAEFFAEIGVVLEVDGVNDLVRFLQKACTQGGVGLFPVPWAAIGSAKMCHHEAEPFERGQ
jgi:hypothetical protein